MSSLWQPSTSTLSDSRAAKENGCISGPYATVFRVRTQGAWPEFQS
jgi:hypothetical protein